MLTRRAVLIGLIVSPVVLSTGAKAAPTLVPLEQVESSRSALQEVGVRRLVKEIAQTLQQAYDYVDQDPNDALTQKFLRDSMTAYLQNLKEKRALIDFVVVCDSTNNPPSVVDNNEIPVVDIAVKPLHSMNEIRIHSEQNREG
jgi:phage tail sheath protein FI